MRHLRPIDGGGEDGWPKADVIALIDDVIKPAMEILERSAHANDLHEVRRQLQDIRRGLDAAQALADEAPPQT